MSYLLGFVLIYGVPALLAYVFWRYPIRRLIALWVGRDVMLGFIPKAKAVHHSERLLRLAQPTPTTTLKDLIAGIPNKLR